MARVLLPSRPGQVTAVAGLVPTNAARPLDVAGVPATGQGGVTAPVPLTGGLPSPALRVPATASTVVPVPASAFPTTARAATPLVATKMGAPSLAETVEDVPPRRAPAPRTDALGLPLVLRRGGLAQTATRTRDVGQAVTVHQVRPPRLAVLLAVADVRPGGGVRLPVHTVAPVLETTAVATAADEVAEDAAVVGATVGVGDSVPLCRLGAAFRPGRKAVWPETAIVTVGNVAVHPKPERKVVRPDGRETVAVATVPEVRDETSPRQVRPVTRP